jgi:hypothetical protein
MGIENTALEMIIQQVGGALHTEYWIPAEDLHTFNENIVGEIQVIREFR